MLLQLKRGLNFKYLNQVPPSPDLWENRDIVRSTENLTLISICPGARLFVIISSKVKWQRGHFIDTLYSCYHVISARSARSRIAVERITCEPLISTCEPRR